MARGNNGGRREEQEDIGFLRQKVNSLMLRGNYAECAKLIEANLEQFYSQERRLESLPPMLQALQRCYPSLGHAQSYEEYLSGLLAKNGIPFVLARVYHQQAGWSVEYFRERAITCKNSGDLEEAMAYCDVALHMEPYNSNNCLLRGWILEDLGRGEEARQMYEKALEHNQTNYQASNSLARYYRETNPKKALAYIEEAIEAHPKEASFYATRAVILETLGDVAEALIAYDNAMAYDTENPVYPYDKAELLRKGNRHGPALTFYRRAVAADPDHVPSLLRLAELCKEKQPEQALEYINAAVHRQPHNLQAQLTAARIRRRLGDVDGAIKEYRRILAEHDNSVEALKGIGGAMLRDDPSRALDYFDRALEAAPEDFDCHMGRGEALQRLEDLDGAVKEFKAALSLNKREARPYAELGRLYTAQEKHKEALDCLTKACEMAPENAYYQADRGTLLVKLPGRDKEAMQCLNLASSLDPGNASLHMQLAEVLDKSGKRASAIRHYQLAANLEPDLPGAHYGLTRLLKDTEPHNALAHINQAINLDGVNGLYYYTKAQLLTGLNRHERVKEVLAELQAKEGKAGNFEMADELGALINGEVLRVALFYVDRAIELDPQNSGYVCLRARLFGEMGQPGRAMEQYEKLLKMDPDNHEALFGVGQLLAAKKDPKALEYMDRAIRLAPGVAQYHAGRGSYLAKDPGQYQAAVESFATATTLDVYAWETLLEMGRLMDGHGDEAGAQDCYRKALLAHRDCVPAAQRMAQLLSAKKPHAALSYIEHVIGLDGENPLYRVTRAGLLFRINETGKAEVECAQAIELGEGVDDIYRRLAAELWETVPEKALEYILVVEEREEESESPTEETLILCGTIYQALGNVRQAWEYFAKAAALAPQSHGAKEKLADLLFEQRAPESLQTVNSALEQTPDCHHCNFLKACILEDLLGEEPETALACVGMALEARPDNPEYRAKLVEMLQKRRSLMRYLVEKHRLGKLLRRLEREELAAREAEEVDFHKEEPDSGEDALVQAG